MFIKRDVRPSQSISRRFFMALSLALPISLSASLTTVAQPAQEPLEIVALGDSLTAGYQLAPGDGFVPQLQAALDARGHHVIIYNAGVSGDTSAGGLARLDWSIGEGTDAVILELGANDALRGLPPKGTRDNLRQIIERITQRGIPVLLAGMYAPPNLGSSYANHFNTIYPDLATTYDLIFDRFFLEGVAGKKNLNLADAIHPNAQGIHIIVRRILPKVEQLIEQTKQDVQ